ncbi:MAG: Rpn family recombination-promoting nuclease/putative transposase [Odoribacter splanchnicus]
MKYLNPKADLTFKRVFGEHPDVVISFLNALLPFGPDEEIEEIEYLPAEMVPENPLRKNSIVDVRCQDKRGRQFLVEMQMIWSSEFKQRVLFNASKAYVRQIDCGEEYELLQPVYSLNLVDEVFEPELEGYYHYYKMVHVEHSEKVIEGLHLIFVELPKFDPHTYTEKKMQVLWLRFMTEIDENTTEVPEELLADPQMKKAVEALEESAFTKAQLLGYEKFWDIISVEKTLYNSAERRGLAKGLAEGLEKGLAEGLEKGLAEGLEKGLEKGRAEGKAEQNRVNALKFKQMGIPSDIIAQGTGLSVEEIEKL